MKRVLTVIVCLGLAWSLITLLNLSSRQADLQRNISNQQKKFDALKALYDQAKEDKADSDAAWQEKSRTWEEMTLEMEELRQSQAAVLRDNLGLIQENGALRRETALLARMQEDNLREWTERLRQAAAEKEEAEKRLSDALAVLMPAAAE